MRRALDEYFIAGIKTTIPFFKRLMEDPEFLAGDLDTGLLDRMLAAQPAQQETAEDVEVDAAVIGAALYFASRNGRPPAPQPDAAPRESAWKREGRRDLLRS
jgi:acetyl/propionyl-CoA carboxylase alpha subunit